MIISTVLLVDDSRFMRRWLTQILQERGFEIVAEASNGVEALARYNMTKPDLVIMDVAMNKMNGIQALERLMHTHPEAKVIMCSSLGDDFAVRRCLSLGAIKFIRKPYFNDLVQVLEEVALE
ncbi:response regulator [Thalassobacillus sp. CUG 92003]|uniref:response regulator n=1 Tax=Thalassobacillus sp. CUG 92003 TaxID=2736641 RepID=UPI0021035CAF|nr:response regulator [Thalassobacillus sp. CUG 92003]